MLHVHRWTLAGLAVPLVCAACVSTNAAVLDSSVSYRKICPDGVQIFTSTERVPGPYQEVALLNSSGESSWTSEKGMMHSQQQKAAGLGANGIIVGDTKEPNAGTKIIGSILGTGAERKGKAVAIFIPSDTLRVQRVCKITPRALATPYQQPAAQERSETSPYGTVSRTVQQTPAPADTAGASPGHLTTPTRPASQPEAAAPPTPAAAPAVTPSPSEAAAPTDTSGRPVAGYDKLPLGTNYVGDARIKVFYPLGCAAQHAIPPDSQVFFQTTDGAIRDGFKASGDC